MKAVTPQEALELVREGRAMSREELGQVQQERLDALVSYAREYSVYYKEKYADLPDNPSLEMLPPVTKQELTARMPDWVTDPEFSEDGLADFLHDLGTLGGLFMDKYSVSTTSGTTGEPLRMLRDTRHVNINGALLMDRLYNGPVLNGKANLADPTIKCASVIATGGHHGAYTAFEKHRRALEEKGITDTMLLLSIGEAVEDMVAKLNEFQPDLLTGYPSILHVLSGEQEEGRLSISPKVILCSAEQLTDEIRKHLETRFKSPVGNVFCSTEGGEIALLCEYGRMHLNSDWILVEPIDKEGNPVEPGTMSDAVLVTNLMNAVQPIIRYRVDDCVILHDAQCQCGSPFPYIDILGRSDDIPEFQGPDEGTIRLSPIVFLAAICDIEGLSIYQFIQPTSKELVARVQYLEGADPEAVNKEIMEEVRTVLTTQGLDNVAFSIENAEPQRAKRGKKMKTYVKDF